MFLGEYRHTLDEKGRLTVPARFRDPLEEGAYVTRGFDRNLMVLERPDFDRLVAQLNRQSVTDSSVRELSRVLFSQAEFIQPDKSGRILLPQQMRSKHDLDGEVVIVGVGNYFEIWNPDQWAAHTGHLDQVADDANYFKKLDIDFGFGDD